jgi:hypothetical protein
MGLWCDCRDGIRRGSSSFMKPIPRILAISALLASLAGCVAYDPY